MPENESEEGLKGRLKTLEGHGEGAGSIAEPETTENEDPKQQAVTLLLEGKSSVADIASQVGLPTSVVGGLKSQLMKKGYLQSEKTEGGSRVEPKKPSSPEDEMRQEMLSVLKEELSITPGIGEQGLAYILKRFSSDEELGLDPNKLHFMIARHAPRMDDFDVKDVVERVFKVTETYHLDRLRGMRQFPGYRTGPRNTGFPGYSCGSQMYPGYGSDQPRTYSEEDMRTQLRFRDLEGRIEKVDDGLRTINSGLEDLNKKLDINPKQPVENESVKRLEDKIERLQEDLTRKDKEFDEKQREHMQNQLGELKSEIKELRGNVGEWKQDEFKLLGTAMDKMVDFGKQVLDKAPLAQAAQQISKAVMPGQQQEVPAEARKTVIEMLRSEGLTVPE